MEETPVNFMFKNTRYAFRRLKQLPRINEMVSLKTPQGTPKTFVVLNVFHDIYHDEKAHRQVYIYLKDLE